MKFHATPIHGLWEIETAPHGDARGSLTRLYCADAFAEVAPGLRFVQVNHSITARRGTLRGMHFQRAPASQGNVALPLSGIPAGDGRLWPALGRSRGNVALPLSGIPSGDGRLWPALGRSEAKLIRCLRGRVFDVAVDLRFASPTFAQWHAVELSEDNQRQVLIPPGCAHGFQTLADHCELLYQHSAAYAPHCEDGVAHDDPLLAIAWPEPVTELSPRDQGFALLSADFKGVRT